MGSLLGVSIHRQKFSFPVGKVEFLNMYPMDFEEFIMSSNNKFLIEEIKNCFESNKPLE